MEATVYQILVDCYPTEGLDYNVLFQEKKIGGKVGFAVTIAGTTPLGRIFADRVNARLRSLFTPQLKKL